jgi:aldehyde dehydrogenase (NAD+)
MGGTVIEMPLYTKRNVNGAGVDIDQSASIGAILVRSRAAQTAWAATPLKDRLCILKKARGIMALSSCELAASIPLSQPSSLSRNLADTLVAEVLPLAEASRFLENQAPSLLRARRLGSHGRPVWMSNLHSEVHRVPLGVVLIIAPSNYPLFLPGVQALQALAAGNAVLWKPAQGGQECAHKLSRILTSAGLPSDLLQVLDPSLDAGLAAMRAGVDKVFLTGHADTGRAVMQELASTLTPSVMELSGCDAVFVLPGADLERVAQALSFGMRLNGSATCMAPRRVFATPRIIDELLYRLLPKLDGLPWVELSLRVRGLLDFLLKDAEQRGAVIVKDGRVNARFPSNSVTPTVVKLAHPGQAIMETDIFAPLLAFCAMSDDAAALAAHEQSPYSLTAAVFGPPRDAAQFAGKVRAGTVLINDLIVSTADPRVPFGGRGFSGFGVTRGAEGLLEMTAVKTILRQTSQSLRPYAQTTKQHEPFFSGFIEVMHAGSLKARLRGLKKLFSTARKLENK